MPRPCKNCKKKQSAPPPIEIVAPVQPPEPIKEIVLPEQPSADLRRSLVGKTIRIRFRRPE